jgi:hypothetical protein
MIELFSLPLAEAKNPYFGVGTLCTASGSAIRASGSVPPNPVQGAATCYSQKYTWIAGTLALKFPSECISRGDRLEKKVEICRFIAVGGSHRRGHFREH